MEALAAGPELEDEEEAKRAEREAERQFRRLIAWCIRHQPVYPPLAPPCQPDEFTQEDAENFWEKKLAAEMDYAARRAAGFVDEPLLKTSQPYEPNDRFASWRHPETRIARSTRHKVTVELAGKLYGPYRSTAEAFRILDLPAARRMRFRVKLKEAGAATFIDDDISFGFRIVHV